MFSAHCRLCGSNPAAGAKPRRSCSTAGNDDYRAGKYAGGAATQYQEIIDQGMVSAEVYFNLGNAVISSGKNRTGYSRL